MPGVELVVEAQLSHDSDPYLNDHEYQGVPLLPAVMGLEAMAATRVWAAAECLKKAGAAFDLPLVARCTSPDDWVVLGAGETTVATWVTAIGSVATKLAVAILVSKNL